MTKYDVIGIGNAIVDVIAKADDSYLDLMGIQKGIMQLVERERGEMLYGAMQDRTQAAGGSLANSIAGLGMLGLRTGFIGRVRDDALGRYFADEMANGGTDFVNPPVKGGELPTSRSMILVSPDGERSMNTYLGISAELGPEDVDEAVAADARILFLEGYLYDKDKGKAAFEATSRATRAAGGMAGITLSDPFCVDRHRGDFRRMVGELDYVIGNEHEWKSLYETDDLGTALETAAGEGGVIVCTRSGHDVVLIRGDEQAIVPVTPITPVDATGAGDLFAAGFLYGLATDAPLATAGRMGCVAAAEVISHYGARPEGDLKALFKAEGLI
ncbi:MAG: adenosine kinase [Pseudooceanicola sp.]